MVQLQKIITDGALLSILASLMIVVSMRVNPRIWLQDYPQEIQAKVPPKTVREKQLSLIFGIPFLLLLVAVPFWSTYTLRQQFTTPFLGLLLNAFGVAFIFNLVDWLILDWLMFCTLTPAFIVIPGTQGMAAYKDYGYHFRGFLIGTVFSAVAGLVIAGLVSLLF